MRNTQAPTDQASSTSKTRMIFAAAIATLLITTSCTTSQQVAYLPDTNQVQSPAQPEAPTTESRWQLVSDQPPTYYPVGLSKDAETDYRHGDWVRAGENDTMWFIPIHGIGNRTEQELRHEALAMATKGQKVDRALDTALDGALDGASGLVGAAAETYSFLAGGEGPEEIITEMNQR